MPGISLALASDARGAVRHGPCAMERRAAVVAGKTKCGEIDVEISMLNFHKFSRFHKCGDLIQMVFRVINREAPNMTHHLRMMGAIDDGIGRGSVWSLIYGEIYYRNPAFGSGVGKLPIICFSRFLE